ncbi:MAG: RDD family protein [Vicinamibacteria bacterium]
MKHRIVTADGATIEFVPAGPARRFLAGLLDASIVMAAVGSAQQILGGFLPKGVSYAISAFIAVFASIAYGVVGDLRFDGRTLGKRWQSLRVVDDRGRVLSLAQSLVRNVARTVDFLPAFYGAGALSMFVDDTRRRLGDRLAGTLVIDERSSEMRATAPSKNLIETTLRRADIRRKGKALSSEERDLLGSLFERADSLAPQARFDLFEETAAHFGRKLQLPSVDALSGENFLRVIASALSEDESRGSRLKQVP